MSAEAQAATDARFMRVAVRMAERGLGQTAPNPSVGAVLVRFDQHPAGMVVGRGWTQPGGRPHAEVEALRAAGEAARGATLYVTLEPCSHYGKTPPCAEAVIAAGVTRVVAGIEDPDVRVSGRGFAMLRAAGIEVVCGVEAAACRRVTLGHILRVTERRPMVLLKMALDETLAVPKGRDGKPRFVTNPEARALGHLARAQSDAILVGSGTVRDDDPELTCRLPGLAYRSPKRVVLDSTLSALTPATKLARTAHQTPVWVMTTVAAPPERRATLEEMGVRVSMLPGTRPAIGDVLRRLADSGITRVLVEGGQSMWDAFLQDGTVDQGLVIVAGSHRGAAPPLSSVELRLVATGRIATDTYFQYESV